MPSGSSRISLPMVRDPRTTREPTAIEPGRSYSPLGRRGVGARDLGLVPDDRHLPQSPEGRRMTTSRQGLLTGVVSSATQLLSAFGSFTHQSNEGPIPWHSFSARSKQSPAGSTA